MEAEEQLIREWILQLKTGHVLAAEFESKFGVNPLERFAEVLEQHASDGYLELEPDGVRLTPEGLLLVDGLLPAFFLPQHRSDRYV